MPHDPLRDPGQGLGLSSITAPEGFAGGVLDVAEGVILGWAHDPENGPCTVTIMRAGKPVGTVEASDRLSGFLHLPPELRDRGFAFDLGALYEDADEEFTVGICAGPRQLPIVRDLVIHPPSTTLEQLMCEGYCENNAGGMIRGWVWRCDRPDMSMDVALYLDGELWRVEKADRFRKDLADVRKGTGAYGFSVPVPAAARKERPMMVDVRLAGTGLRLRRSPLRIEGNTVTVVA